MPTKNKITWKMHTVEAISIFKYLLSTHAGFIRYTKDYTLHIDMRNVDRQMLKKEIFDWLKRRT